MEDTLMIVIAIGTAVVLMIVVPFMSMADRTDDVVQLTLETALSDFVTTVSTKGEITQDDYSKLVEKISATGNAYDIAVEIQFLDENPGKKTSQVQSTKIGENTYVAIYESQFLEQLDKNGKITLKEGDIVTAGIEKESKSLADILHDVFLGASDDSSYIAVDSKMVTTNGAS